MNNLFWKLFFPAYCIVCEKYGKYLCAECLGHIPIKNVDFCPICQKTETFAGRVCNLCENRNKKIYLDGIIVASYFKHPVLREAVYHYKYNFVRDLSWPLAKILLKKLYLLESFPFETFDFTAVPLHEKRFRWRGFNQACLLGKKLNRLLARNNLDIFFLPDLLFRHKYKKPQMKIHTARARKINIAGNFKINPKFSKKAPRKIIIIDDVLTTGATLNECAKVLKRHGAEKVWGLVLARQKPWL